MAATWATSWPRGEMMKASFPARFSTKRRSSSARAPSTVRYASRTRSRVSGSELLAPLSAMRTNDADAEAVADRKDRCLELHMPQKVLVEGTERVGVLVMLAGRDAAAPEDVVHRDHAARGHLRQQRVEIRDVLGLDGVDERELTPRRKPRDHPQRRLVDHPNAVGHSGAQPVAAGAGRGRARGARREHHHP